VLASAPIFVAGLGSDGIDATELTAAFWAGVDATGLWHVGKKLVPSTGAAKRATQITLPSIALLAILLGGCAGSLEESKLAGLDPQARAAAQPASERCQSLDNEQRWLGGASKGLVFLGGASGIATWPVESHDAKVGLAIGAGVAAAGAVVTEYIADGARSRWAQECSQ